MSINHVRIYKDGITKRCSDILGNNVYLTNGQGCDTIWFKTVKAAQRAFKKDGVKTGHDFFDCSKCGCHYSITEKGFRFYPQYACRTVTEEYAKKFE